MPTEQTYEGSGKWFLLACLHQDAIEIELPLIRIFSLKWLIYKQWVCPKCKCIVDKSTMGYVCSRGDGSNEK